MLRLKKPNKFFQYFFWNEMNIKNKSKVVTEEDQLENIFIVARFLFEIIKLWGEIHDNE